MRSSGINAAVLLGMTQLTFCGFASNAFAAEATPFTCGNGQRALLVNTGDTRYGIGKTREGVTASSNGQQGRAGVDFTNLNQKFSTISLFARDPIQADKYVNTKLCFTDADGTFTVQKKLREYRPRHAPGDRDFNEFELNASDFGSRAAQATLTRLTLVLNTPNNVPASITFGGIEFNDIVYRQIFPQNGNGGCEAANACSKDENPG